MLIPDLVPKVVMLMASCKQQETEGEKKVRGFQPTNLLGGCFKYFQFSSLFGANDPI